MPSFVQTKFTVNYVVEKQQILSFGKQRPENVWKRFFFKNIFAWKKKLSRQEAHMQRGWEWLMTHQPVVSCVQMHSLASVQLFDYAQGSSFLFCIVLFSQ